MNKLFALLFSSILLLCACKASDGSKEESSSISSTSSASFSSKEETSTISSEKSSESQSESESISESTSSETSESSSSSTPIIPEYDPSQYYDGYYSNIVSWENGVDLKEQLYELLHNENYHPINYAKPNWTSNKLADKSLNDFAFVDAVYAKVDIDASQTHRSWQREHAFPATLMTGSLSAYAVNFLGRATDFHNLFASDSSGNMSRGNKNYGVADKTKESYQDRTTDGGYNGYSFDETTFEPADYDKGRLARAIFYMATMYSKDEYDSVNNVHMKGLTIVEDNVSYIPGDDCHFAIGNLSTLLDWNNYDVDFLEMQHNQSVYADVIELFGDPTKNVAQGNRNPFVDYPELVEYVFGDKQNEAGELKYIEPSYLKLNMDEDVIHHYAIKEAKREYGYGDTLSKDDYSVVSVNNDHSVEEVSDGVSNSLDKHTFTTDDGEFITAIIAVEECKLQYQICLDPMKTCSYNSGPLDKTGLSINTTSRVTYNDEPFDVEIKGGSGLTISNDSTGGFYLGSGTANKDLSSIKFTSVERYEFNKGYIKCRANNNGSTFTLSILVDDEVVASNIKVTSNGGNLAIHGASFEPKFGQISFLFTGSNALRINSFAFNVSE